MLAYLVLLAPQWKSTFFEDVQLHRGAPPVTVQVAHLEPEHPATDSAMPMVISVFTGPKGARKLVSSTRAGMMAWNVNVPEFAQDKNSGEGFLAISLMIDQKWVSGLFIFDGNKPRKLLHDFSMYADNLRNGLISQWSNAKEWGVRVPKGDYPNPPISRTLKFDAKSRKFRPGPWRIEVINGPAKSDVRGSNNGHTFRIQMEKRNFRLGNRRFTVHGNDIKLDGGGFIGGDPYPELVSTVEKQRTVFGTEFVSFRVWIDGKRIVVPGRLWRRCFDPHFPPTGTLSRDGSVLSIDMGGSDGAGSYAVTWTVRRDGRCTSRVRSLD
jgi:hypothetical protein